jgi:hypothetical protein
MARPKKDTIVGGLDKQLESAGGIGGSVGSAAPRGATPIVSGSKVPKVATINVSNARATGPVPTGTNINPPSWLKQNLGPAQRPINTQIVNAVMDAKGSAPVAAAGTAGVSSLLKALGVSSIGGVAIAGLGSAITGGGGSTGTSGPRDGDIRTDFADGIAREWRNGGWRLVSTTPDVTPDETPVEEVGGGEGDGEGDGEGGETGTVPVVNSEVARFLRENNIENIIQPPTNLQDYLTEASSVFRGLYGDSPDYDALEKSYLDAIRSAYNEILGEGGTLDQARAIADRQFGIAEGQMERGFRESRRQLAEQAFLGQRQMQQQLAERGLGGSGLAQLGVVQQKIAEGGAASNLYRQFTESLQQLSVSKSQSELQFAEARSNLNLALTRDTQDVSNRFRQERQQYNQWRGNTMMGIAEAIREGNFQSYQMKIDEWNRGLQAASIMDQETKDAANMQLQVTETAYSAIIAGIEANDDLTDEEKKRQIAQTQADQARAFNEITANFGLTAGDIVSNIMGNQTPSEPRQPGVFTDEERNFRGIIPAIPRALESMETGIVKALFGERFSNRYRENRLGRTSSMRR